MPMLFVYGTLKKGCKNHQVLRNMRAEFVGRGITPGLLINLGPFPGFVQAPATEVQALVTGELYVVDDDMIRRCDRFEGVPNLYTREEVQVRNLDTGTYEMAYVYQVTDATIESFKASGRIIPSGVWVE